MKKNIYILISVTLMLSVIFGCDIDFDKYKVTVPNTSQATQTTANTKSVTTKSTTTKSATTTPRLTTTSGIKTTVPTTTLPPTTVMAEPTRTIQYIQNGEQKSITVTLITGFEDAMIARINSERAQAGVSALALNARLSEFAIIRAAEAGVQWSHTRPDGTQCFTVLDTDPEFKSHISEAGENLAWNQTTVTEVMDAWMQSPGHRENILKLSYNYVGLACVIVYRDSGSRDHLWAQMFAKIE
ncbi:MAG: CAP domain-containing protein [Sphingobacteriia bacterium]|nr:CAP domain-containing protein [Sphingobacteriia bacterium]